MCELPWYSHKSYRGYVSSPLFVKVIMIGLHKLSDLRCMSYHAIHTKRYGGYFFNTHPYAKVIRTELYKLSGCDMRVILIFTQKWPGGIPPGRLVVCEISARLGCRPSQNCALARVRGGRLRDLRICCFFSTYSSRWCVIFSGDRLDRFFRDVTMFGNAPAPPLILFFRWLLKC